ncbi:MAG: hypothetical protein DDT19_02347 [Syntrophomonadaceae bacterium]|nr:hypothetical protein [Bacillota bacterium]
MRDDNQQMENKEFDSKKQVLVVLAKEIEQVLQEIKNQNDLGKKENAENGRMEFAYVEYYLAEICSLLNLSVYLLGHDAFRKYTYFPARLIMEIVLQLEHVYSVKKKKGANGVRRLFFKDIAISAKSSLAWPGEKGKDKISSHLSFLDITSKILRLDFKTENVPAKSNRGIKALCDKSSIVLKNKTGSDLYSFYEVLSESSHANVMSIGVSNHENDEVGALEIFTISLELSIRFCEIVISKSGYRQLENGLGNLKRVAGI